ncbi:hypothetical protein [Nocardia sp. NPDC057030]|uniref:hypothetical protein n=1 Tax=unclassified Nocardia TaxID=2637762 RepID=UPI00363946DE
MTTDPRNRITLTLHPSTAAAIRAYSESKCVGTTEAVKRLITLGNVLFQADIAGKKVLLKDGDEIECVLIVD